MIIARTRAVSAYTTRATRSARSRHNVPYAAAHSSASSISPPAIGAERDASSGRCGAVRCGRAGPSPHAMALRQRRARACTGCACGRSCPATHGTAARACWGRRATSTTLHRPWSLYATGTGPRVAHGRSDGTRAPQTGAAARERVLLVCSRGGDETRKFRFRPPGAPGTMPSTLKCSARRPNPTKHPRLARPREVHVVVGWIPPLQKVDRNDTRPAPPACSTAPERPKIDVSLAQRCPWSPGPRTATRVAILPREVAKTTRKCQNRLLRGVA